MSHGPGSYKYEGPNDPPSPEEEPTHDVPTFPEEDTPPGTETAIRIGGDVRRVAGFKFAGHMPAAGPGEHDSPDEGDDDVDEDDLDPQVPHSPPDATHASHGQTREGMPRSVSGRRPRNGKKGRIVFDENYVAG